MHKNKHPIQKQCRQWCLQN